MSADVLAIIQARVGSTRLPRKVLLPLEGATVLERVIERVRGARRVDMILVATTTNPEDSEIGTLCASWKIPVSRGSVDDVLDRFFSAAKPLKPRHIVRITADCPLIDPRIVDALIELHLESSADYATNTLPPTFPDGEDAEVLTYDALERAWREARKPSEREHVTSYIWENSSRFKCVNLSNVDDLSAKRWTIDNPEDYRFVSEVYRFLHRPERVFGLAEITALLAEHPELERINAHIKRNEGYHKSLNADKEAT